MYRILLVDDEILVRDAIRENIDWGAMDCQLVGDCENGRQAMEFVTEHPVDIVLTDICMPYMDGMELSKFLHEKYPDIFSQTDTSVLTIDVERTFWEKLTILHKIANFPEGKSLPARYARHLYDVYNMGNSWVKESAFKRKELLEKDVAFKQKFYYAKGAHYETATLSSIELLPKEAVLNALKEDYQAMSNMIYGNIPEFEDILAFLKKLQSEIHELSNTKL